MDRVTKLLKDVDAIRKVATLRLARAKELELKAMTLCKHPSGQIVEGAYRPSDFGQSSPPFRVCRKCGYAEEGWYCGYYLLADRKGVTIPEMDRDSAHKFVRFFLDNKQVAEAKCGR